MKAPFALPIFATVFLSACTTQGEDTEPRVRGVAQFEGDPRLGEEVNRACFASSIDSFSEATDDTVVIHISPRKAFLVETFGTCYDLDHALSVGVASRSGCLSKGDKIIASDSAFGLRSSGIGPSTCTIKALYEWDKHAEPEEEETEETT